MNLRHYYWWFKSAIPPRICDDIVKYGLNHKEDMAITGGLGRDRDIKKQPLNKKEIKDLKKKRDSNVVWMSDRWIYKEIQPYINQANVSAEWNFNWDWSESCQFTKYKSGQYYDWHCDSWESPYEKGLAQGKIRKLSVTISLSDEKDYEGGELEFDFRNNDPHTKRNTAICKEILPRGSVVVFPSFVWHRVKPVTKGVRYSLVIWNVGYPFK
jgi:PKHD-type hydroxylase|tara:strand:- start:1502 stop:2137 length:636 start_codon:yes stop_codon:yes gene_type:complete